jgi:hypothetical protein
LSAYPPDSSQFLKKQKNPMANPIGSTLRRSLEDLLIQWRQGFDPEKITSHLDRIVHIRAVEDNAPSQALAFIFQLKGIVREVLAKDLEKTALAEELAVFEAQVDYTGLLAFDAYAACRQKLAEIRVRDEHRRLHMLLRRANLITEGQGDADLTDSQKQGSEDH